MYCPRPPAPIAAAIVADPTPTTAATRTPATMDGSASGSSTCRSSSRGVMPIATPASRIDRSMPVMPTIVERTIGSSAYSTSTVSAARAPTPPMSGTGSRKPNIARLGIVWTMLAIATSGEARRGRRAANTPSGTPSATAIVVETTTSTTCSPTSAASSCWCASQKRMTEVTRRPPCASGPRHRRSRRRSASARVGPDSQRSRARARSRSIARHRGRRSDRPVPWPRPCRA